MSEAWWGLPAALWLGILTSISPCPLAANVAAISYIGRRLDRPRLVLAGGLLYTLGRVLAYAALGALIVASVLAVPQVSRALQKSMNQLLGPLLLLAGALLLGWARPVFGGGGLGARLAARADRASLWGAMLLGMACALAFCPVSAALFFGSLIPLAVRHGSRLALPAVYGIGTGLPVFAFAVLIALGARRVALLFDRVAAFEKWARRATGIVFLAVGAYYVLAYNLGLV